MSTGLARFNSLGRHRARAELLRCCGSENWARQMGARRPFASVEELLDTADEIWSSLGKKDWLQAFGHHPRIGGSDIEQDRFEGTRNWSRSEQSGMADASEEMRAELASGNDAYYERFGYIFLICAAGKTAQAILQQLEARSGNDPETELGNAAEQQRLITRLRLEKLLRS
ncbi:MAG: 2-oxo-4-hydroxy-4-carboxy-5-ureidoimidazoline decarboxylase [Acidobacteriota bacterium]